VAATVCGGCHTDARHPTFDEWSNSAHALVTNLLVTNFNAANKMFVTNLNVNAADQISSCGRCHSGSARLSLLETNALPTGDANIGIVCVTCHDPHQTNAYPAQLRNPVASTNDYFMSTNGVFLSQYNARINVCAQCHNHAGASWTNNACEPHHSLQYNMLLGTIGEGFAALPAYQPGSHALLITNQCVGCHMQTTPFVSEAQPAVTGHSFAVKTYGVCLTCHTSVEPIEFLVAFVTSSVSNEIQQVVFDLDYWATNKAPASLMAKYGTLAWEYTTPGGLSSGGPGPDATEQTNIPVNIRKARFNLYVAQNDGSFGIHNPEYVAELVSQAEAFIQEEFDPKSVHKKARPEAGGSRQHGR
jgi:formate-dependent nitrite reductase cytochrome c552 subunit